MVRLAPTETRIALRYSGSQQQESSSTASAPKAAALRKMPPILSWLPTPISATTTPCGPTDASSASAEASCGGSPMASTPRCMGKPAMLSSTSWLQL